MPRYLCDQFFKYLHNRIAGILPVLKVFKAKSEYQVHITLVQFPQHLEITGIPVVIQQHLVRHLFPIAMSDF